jgi:hypothetical protein
MNNQIPLQDRVAPWMQDCFGPEISRDIRERCHRFFEEAGELCQSLGMTEDDARRLVTYTWGRPQGAARQEVGGVMITLAALCLATHMDMHEEGEVELERISQPEVRDKIRLKQQSKKDIFGPLP